MSDRLLYQDWIVFRHEPRAATGFAALASNLRAVWRRQRSRHRLARLDAHLLKDIGVSFADAEAEANKPFWQD